MRPARAVGTADKNNLANDITFRSHMCRNDEMAANVFWSESTSEDRSESFGNRNLRESRRCSVLPKTSGKELKSVLSGIFLIHHFFYREQGIAN